MRKFSVILSLIFLCLFLNASARADLFDYSGNNSYDTLRINDYGHDRTPSQIQNNEMSDSALFKVFNQYFGTAYETSDALYADRGRTPTTNQVTIGEDAQVQSIFKDAAFKHVFSMLREDGTTAASFEFADKYVSMPSDPKSLSPPGLYEILFKAYDQNDTLVGDYSFNTLGDDGFFHLVVLDVSDLLGGEAFLVAVEDAIADFRPPSDWDYNDGVYLFTSVVPPTVPEPATALIFGIGLGAIPVIRRWRKKTVK